MFVNGYKWIASGVFPGFGERDRFTCMLTKSADDLKWMGGGESDMLKDRATMQKLDRRNELTRNSWNSAGTDTMPCVWNSLRPSRGQTGTAWLGSNPVEKDTRVLGAGWGQLEMRANSTLGFASRRTARKSREAVISLWSAIAPLCLEYRLQLLAPQYKKDVNNLQASSAECSQDRKGWSTCPVKKGWGNKGCSTLKGVAGFRRPAAPKTYERLLRAQRWTVFTEVNSGRMGDSDCELELGDFARIKIKKYKKILYGKFSTRSWI